MVGTRTARSRGALARSASKALRDDSPDEKKKAATPAAKTPAAKKAATKEAATGTKVRVWWEPTKSKKRTDFAGMYWPATFVRKSGAGKIQVKYDNGETDDVSVENVSPNDCPVEYGEEKDRLEVGEFCEVFNNSETDPAAWFARISKANKKTYAIEYPFHDSEPETVKDSLVRRARVWDESSKTWKLIAPFQVWKDGEISSPVELERVTEAGLKKALAAGPPKDAGAEKGKATEKAAPASAAEADTPAEASGSKKKRGRPKKTAAQKAEDKIKKQRLADEAVAEAEAAQAAIPPVLGTMPSLPAGTPPGMQGLQTMLSNPNMLNLLQSIMAGTTGRPPVPGIPGMPGMPPAAEVVAPQPPAQIYIPPLPEEETPAEAAPSVPEVHPKVPKKARSAYILFSMDFRKDLDKAVQFNDATKQAAEKWKVADEAMRKKYEDMANAERMEYAKLQGEYLEKKAAVDARLAEKASKEAARKEAILAHEEAKRKQLEANSAYQKACQLAGVVPGPVPQVPGDPVTLPEAMTADERLTNQLNKLDMEKARKHIIKYYHEDAWYMLVDAWRKGSDKLESALMAAKTHVFSKLRADWKAFMIGTFGMDMLAQLTRKEGDAPAEDEDHKDD